MSDSNFVFPPPPPPPPVAAAQSFPGNNGGYGSNSNFRGGRGQDRGRGRGGFSRGPGGSSRGHGGQHLQNQGHIFSGGNSNAQCGSTSLVGQEATFIQTGSQQHQRQNAFTPTYQETNSHLPMTAGFELNTIGNYAQNQYLGAGLNAQHQGMWLADRGHAFDQLGSTDTQSGTGFAQGTNRGEGQAGFRFAKNPVHGQKRGYNAAFSSVQKSGLRTSVAPAVPSFGAALPVLLPEKTVLEPAGLEKAKRKRKRKHNQLGLTPRTEEHESSEDDDANEEAKLAASSGSSAPSNVLQFSYKGQNSSLSSQVEIAAWIAERKKRYPTKARAEETAARAAKTQEEAKLKMEQHQAESRLHQEKTKLAAKSKKESAHKKREEVKLEAQAQHAQNNKGKGREKKKMAGKDTNMDETMKAQMKALILQRKLEKAQKELASIEAKNAREKEPNPINSHVAEEADADIPVGTANPSLIEGSPVILGLTAVDQSLTKQVMEQSSSDDTDSVDSDDSNSAAFSSELSDLDVEETSSSGSSSSDTLSDNEAPDESSSKRMALDRVPPPKKTKFATKAVCRDFSRRGRCPRGKGCHFLHIKSERGREQNSNGKTKDVAPRTSLYQRLLARQQEEEDQKLLQHIVHLGKNGILDNPPSGEATMIPGSNSV